MLESDIYTVHFFQCTELFGVKSLLSFQESSLIFKTVGI